MWESVYGRVLPPKEVREMAIAGLPEGYSFHPDVVFPAMQEIKFVWVGPDMIATKEGLTTHRK